MFHFRDMWHMRDEDNPSPVEVRAVELYEAITDSMDKVPQGMWCTADRHCLLVGQDAYEDIVGNAVRAVGFASLPANAAEFVTTLNMMLEYYQNLRAV